MALILPLPVCILFITPWVITVKWIGHFMIRKVIRRWPQFFKVTAKRKLKSYKLTPPYDTPWVLPSKLVRLQVVRKMTE